MLVFLAAIAFSSLVDVDLPPAPLGSLVPKLGEKFGTVMACDGLLRNRVVMIRAQQATEEEVMKRLADVAGGAWERTKTGLVLRRTAALDALLKRQAIEKRAAAIRKKALELSAEVDKTPVFNLSVARKFLDDLALNDAAKGDPSSPTHVPDFENKIFNRGPANRATIRLLALLDASDIASDADGRTVYSLTPNRYQRPLPAPAAEIVRKLGEENEVWRQALESTTNLPSGWIGGDPRRQAHGEGTPAKVILSVSGGGRYAVVSAELYVADAAGTLLVHSRVVVNPGLFSLGGPGDDQNFLKNPDFTFSDESKEFNGFISIDYRKPRPAMTKAWEEKFLNPQKWDPLGFGAREVIVESAKREHLNLIAAMPDEMLLLPTSENADSVNLAAYLLFLQGRCGVSVARADGWMVVKPDEKMGPAALNIDRSAIQKFCGQLHRDGMISLDAASELLLAMPNPGWDSVAFAYTAVLTPRLERLLQFQNQQLLMVFGLLTPDQRRTLRAGGFVGVGNMPLGAQHALETLLLNPDPTADGLMKDGERMTYADPPIDSLPSELLGKGFPAGAGLASKPALANVAVIGTYGGSLYTPWTHVVERDQLPDLLGRSMAHDPDDKKSDIWFGKRLQLRLEIPLKDGYSYHGTLEEVQVNVLTKSTTYADLPADTRNKIDQAMKNAANQRQSEGGGTPPP